MMQQYQAAKREHPDALLFFRMGDFYEMFHEDAKVASRALGLTLTSRDKANPVPMAGVPVKAVDTYLRRLLTLGHKVAICDQVQDPREAKGLVDRAVVRIVTPGTVTEEAVLDARSNNFLAALFTSGEKAGIAWVDLSTGAFRAEDTTALNLPDELGRIDPAELLVPDAMQEALGPLRDSLRGSVSIRPDWAFDRAEARRILLAHFGVATLDGFGCEDLEQALNAAGAVLQYLGETQKTGLGHITHLTKVVDGTFLVMDRATRRALEITESMLDGTRKGTLLQVLDHSQTAMGGRCLRSWLLAPLVDPADIRERHDAVAELVEDSFLRKDVRDALSRVTDLERIAAKIATGRANPRDLVSLRQSAVTLPKLSELLAKTYSRAISGLLESLDPLEDLEDLVARSIRDDPSMTIRDGGIVREGWSEDLDELRSLRTHGKEWIASFQAEEAKRTGIPTLKVGFNKVFGYYIEVTHANRERVPPEYHRKQTLKNAERYITPELKEYETKVLTADERAKDLEADIFLEVRSRVAEHVGRIRTTAAAVARLDALASFAEVASAYSYVRPEITSDEDLVVVEGRHAVLERTLTDEPFVPNDVTLDSPERRILVITGPNMSGKSTYLRQTALIVLMAQAGSFVPAEAARVGVCDRIFARVGASDELSQGKSTFMVEMSETANILNNATSRSLLVLDEIGRGTSTYDGVAIAWAVSEHISRHLAARTLFATHYHELTELAERLDNVVNLNVAVREWGEEVIFLRKIQEGGTDRSYGIHVARIAGVPPTVIERAKAILSKLEEGRPGPERVGPAERQLALFAPPPHPVLDEIRALDPEGLSPVEALLRLTELRKRAKE
jgi:DNA mismatch repair protein MutS